ncbi:uncharacterized protein LOC122505655 [Leptopilina heterotoma]|uniref:uncharacterized protein LOC122505655 n=1 Tax=Leptopilina heterotoma TaxID=63436 RepID=UPI001CA86E1B|nr:uncharacterized protein LOC122505655 [Leptopilina heterotoma]
MKEEIYSQTLEIQDMSPSEILKLEKSASNNKSENNDEWEEIKNQKAAMKLENNNNDLQNEIVTIWKNDYNKSAENNNNNNINDLRDQEIYLVNKLKTLSYPDNSELFGDKKKIEFLANYLKLEEEGCKNGFKILPDDVLNIIIATSLEGDCGRSPDERPDWLDLEKFKRGQKFAVDNAFGISYSQLLSLFILFSFEDGLKPLVVTGKSSTPYTAFKRYISTGRRVRNWYMDDPWKKGTAAYNDIQTVRRMHEAVRKKLASIDNETIDKEAKIKNPFCPTRSILIEDFQSACAAPSLGQCPYTLYKNPELFSFRPKGLNQGDMIATQFGFMGLIILYPSKFGIYNATDENLEAFCHTWRGIGYLLGIDDEFNFCRGTLDEVKQRCRHFLEYWAKPNFRELTPECEHMMRCIIESLKYYVPGGCYETCVLYLSEMLNIQMPRLYSTLTYKMWFRYHFSKILYQYTCQVPGVLWLLNKGVNNALDKALNYSAEKHEELKIRSEETLKKYT